MAIKKTNKQIEDRYADADRQISQERNDFLLPQIIDFVSAKQWMNLRPEYQRRQVWERAKQSRFVESLLMNLPIPPVFLFEPEYNRYEVMDGQQRLSSIVAFYQNRLKLTGLEFWTELNGRYYTDLPTKVQRGLDRRRVSAVVLRSVSDEDKDDELRQIVFERLNTGGQKLNAQELRNCVYSGPLAALLVELAGYETFNDLLEMPRYSEHLIDDKVSAELADNSLFKRMTDCELVLRFFAFREKKAIRGAVKKILDDYMKANRSPSADQISKMRLDFESRIDLAKDLLGEDAFRITEPHSKAKKVSQPFYDAVVVACDRQFANRVQLSKKKAVLRTAINGALKNEENYELIVGRANTAEAIRGRLDLVEGLFTSVL